MNKVLREDQLDIIADGGIPWEGLRGASVLVTGASGLVGSALVRALAALNEERGMGVTVIPLGRDASGARADIRERLEIDAGVDYIFHCAAMTKSRDMVADPAGVIETSLLGTHNILTLAREKQIRGMVYLSSMEVYGITDAALAFVTEKDLGYIDLAAPRSCYPESKRMCEVMCRSWLAQYGVPVKIARLARTFGAGARRDDPRVFAQFARDAAGGSDIVLHTEGASLGNYCYIADAVRGLFLLLLKGVSGEAYNIVNPDACMTIRAMAETVAAMYGVSVRVEPPRDIQSRGYLPDLTARLSADKIKGLGWQPRYGMEDMYKRMIDGWGMA